MFKLTSPPAILLWHEINVENGGNIDARWAGRGTEGMTGGDLESDSTLSARRAERMGRL